MIYIKPRPASEAILLPKIMTDEFFVSNYYDFDQLNT